MLTGELLWLICLLLLSEDQIIKFPIGFSQNNDHRNKSSNGISK